MQLTRKDQLSFKNKAAPLLNSIDKYLNNKAQYGHILPRSTPNFEPREKKVTSALEGIRKELGSMAETGLITGAGLLTLEKYAKQLKEAGGNHPVSRLGRSISAFLSEYNPTRLTLNKEEWGRAESAVKSMIQQAERAGDTEAVRRYQEQLKTLEKWRQDGRTVEFNEQSTPDGKPALLTFKSGLEMLTFGSMKEDLSKIHDASTKVDHRNSYLTGTMVSAHQGLDAESTRTYATSNENSAFVNEVTHEMLQNRAFRDATSQSFTKLLDQYMKRAGEVRTFSDVSGGVQAGGLGPLGLLLKGVGVDVSPEVLARIGRYNTKKIIADLNYALVRQAWDDAYKQATFGGKFHENSFREIFHNKISNLYKTYEAWAAGRDESTFGALGDATRLIRYMKKETGKMLSGIIHGAQDFGKGVGDAVGGVGKGVGDAIRSLPDVPDVDGGTQSNNKVNLKDLYNPG